jgi:ABC-type sugar transport system ATPase subunit
VSENRSQANLASPDASGVGADPPIVELRNVGKHYGRITALKHVSFSIRKGEVVALVGDNGAGKSTLVNIIAGALAPSVGELLIEGEPMRFRSANEARQMGIETVYQDLALANDVPAWANLFLGREIKRRGPLGALGWLDKKAMIGAADEALGRTKIRIKSIEAKCGALSGGQRQAVAVARAINWGSRMLLMDEPTAALGVEQQHQVGVLIQAVREEGTPVLLVSHNLPQVMAVSDRILVLFHGHLVKELATARTTTDEVIKWITGAGLVRQAAS